jgi:hypothetical protein
MKIKHLIWLIAICLIAYTVSDLEAAARPSSKKGMYFMWGLTGGTYGALDTLDITAAGTPNDYDLIENDSAIVTTISGDTVAHYVYVFDASSDDEEASPTIIRPDDYATAGVWRLTRFETEIISEGDSNVEVVDSGTGQVDIDVDSEKQVQITDGYVEVITGTNFRVITETDGHAMVFQVYDVDGGGAWRDALKFEHGDSGDSSATNWPRVHLGSNVALTGLGTMAVGMIWGNAGVPLTTSPTNLEAAGMNQIYKVSGAIQINLPAAADVYSSGSDASWVQFELFAASVLSINPDGTEILRMQGTNLAAGNEIDTPATVGTIVTCIATDDVEDGSSTDGWVCRSNQTLVDGGAS